MNTTRPWRCAWVLVCGSLLAQAENWPQFRGPTVQGLSTETGLPLQWSTDSNVAWKTAIPGESWSSPIVWGDRVFLTTATDGGETCRVLCVDRKSGQVVWDKEIFQQVPRRKEAKNSYATPTPATDGERVYACFYDGSFVAMTFDGSVVWTNRSYPFYSQHGLATSPILHGNRLIMARDGSSEGPDLKLGWQKPWDQSYLLALDKSTGKELWKGRRGMSRIAHAVPFPFRYNGEDQLISIAGDVVQGFDAQTGERIWSAYCQGEGLVPSPVFGAGLIFAASGFEKTTLRGIRPGGKGDVTATHIAWEQKRGVPSQSSLLFVGGHLYTVMDDGMATCIKGETGEVVWQERLNGRFSASPVYADTRIYFLSESGETVVIAAGADFKVLARNPLNEKCQASLAVSRKQLFIRTENHLYCIGKP